MKPSTFLLVMAAIAMSAFAIPAFADDSAQMYPRTPVPDARPVMLAAIQATNGEAHGVLTGDVANAISQRFGASSPIFIDVTTERRYQQPGCSRLKVLFSQDGVLLPGAPAPRKQTMEFGINYCLDGLPPKSLQ
ncbi:hypothetical protein [Rhodoferax sediminis]|uniref:Uncharacterized protein n=1 Tax=Rhodoferax sediminis TaxID=2509614 RepID=A0A515DEB7_9BURK|nr:hypothetical protein [Rhodoferax sediminis]QDL38737.1 hypothetical protein EUB48_16650 [Rhodoferax sediminis]